MVISSCHESWEGAGIEEGGVGWGGFKWLFSSFKWLYDFIHCVVQGLRDTCVWGKVVLLLV